MPPIEHADFTTTRSGSVVCQRCKMSYPEGTNLHFLHDASREGPGKNICEECHQYYVTKTQTAEQPTASRHPSYSRQVTLGHQLTTAAAQQSIRKAVAAAQREGQNHPVRMGGHVVKRTSTSAPVTAVGRVTGFTGNIPWPTRPSSSKPTNRNHPRLPSRQGPQGTQAVVLVPNIVSKPYIPSEYGYQEVHAMYDEMRKWFAQKATSTHQTEVATIKVTLMSMKPNNRNPQMVMDITETISNIPLRIGVSHLKVVAYFTILPPFLKWSHDYPLSPDDVKLRSKNWVEMLPKGPDDQDVDAIENEFFTTKGKAKTRQFLPNKVLDLYLGISHKLRCEIDTYIEERVSSNPISKNIASASNHKYHHDEDAVLSDLFSAANSITNETAREKRPARNLTRKRQLSRSQFPESPPHVRLRITQSQTATASKSVKNAEREGSPTMESMRQALRAQTAPSGKVVKTSLNSTPIKCAVYPTSNVTFTELVAHARAFDAIGDCSGSLTLTLMYNAKAKPKYGSFKQAIFGYLDRPALWSSTSVIVKQCFYVSPLTGARVLYDKHSQLKKITTELNCLRWASALMGIVYRFIDEHTKTTNGNGHLAPLPIPEMVFVKSALAITDRDQDSEVFLLEEVINDAIEGPFIKYIGNGSVRPFDFLNGEELHRGKFLSFCQHVQYLKTKGLAFVGDFQGGRHLLTDPQVITSPETGVVFSDGNVKATLTRFTDEHECTEFCQYFGLEPFVKDLDIIEDGEVIEIK